jgi:hypothetical protein
MLYRNTTGASLSSSDPTELRYQLSSAVELLGFTNANREEVLAQVAAVEDRLYAGEVFKYARGAQVPAQPQELFPLKGRPLKTAELTQASAWAASDLPVVTARAPTGPWPERTEATDDDHTAGGVSAMPATDKEPEVVIMTKKPRKANATGDIRAAADEAWRTAGSPAIVKALLPVLEARDFHPTTIRIQLNKWKKERTS